jgi:heme a synthase
MYKSVIIWLLAGCVLIFAMVVVGGITRLTKSGLSIVEWNVISGTLPPLSERQWLEEFEKYKQFPEYQKLNYNFTLADYKSIFWWEYIHRLLGRVIGLVFIIPFAYFLVRKKFSKPLLKQVLILFGLGALQGFLGWFMVKSGLINKPHVSHYRLALHLITAFTAFAYSLWLAMNLIFDKKEHYVAQPALKKLAYLFFGVLVLQIVYGAFVAGLKAGFVYNTFPKMGSSWIADGVTAIQPFYKNFVEGLAGVQFVHRYLGFLVLGIPFYMWMKSKRFALLTRQIFAIQALVFAVVIQFLLGVFTLLYQVPVSLGVIHQAGAMVLLAITIYIIHSLKDTSKVGVGIEEVKSQKELIAA